MSTDMLHERPDTTLRTRAVERGVVVLFLWIGALLAFGAAVVGLRTTNEMTTQGLPERQIRAPAENGKSLCDLGLAPNSSSARK